jgi:hypothetical protein
VSRTAGRDQDGSDGVPSGREQHRREWHPGRGQAANRAGEAEHADTAEHDDGDDERRE